jgi:hypothetical protein
MLVRASGWQEDCLVEDRSYRNSLIRLAVWCGRQALICGLMVTQQHRSSCFGTSHIVYLMYN